MCLMDIKQGKKAGKALARPTSNQFDKRGCKGEKYHPETFFIRAYVFSWLCLQYWHNHMQMGNALRNANVCSTQGTFCRTSDFNFNFDFNFFYLFSFFPPPSRIFEHIKYIKNHESQKNIRSYNTVF